MSHFPVRSLRTSPSLRLGRWFVFLAVIFLFFSELMVNLGGGVLGYIDELLVVSLFLFGLLLEGGHKKFPVVFLAPVVLMLLGMFFSFFHYFDGLFKVVVQGFINFKLFVLWAGLFFFIRATQVSAGRILYVLWWLSLVGFLFNALFPEFFYSFFEKGLVRERYGAMRIEGFQLKPNDLAIFLSLFCFYINFLFWRGKLLLKPYLFYLVCSGVMILLTGSRLGLVGFFISILASCKISRLPGLVGVFLFVICSFVFLVSGMGQEAIERTLYDLSHFQNIDQTKYIRAIMLYYGVVLAYEYFPIGVGAGNYGTVLSEGSSVYSYLGISHLEFFEDFWGVFDSNLASLLGEYGFIFSFMVVLAYFRIIVASDGLFGARRRGWLDKENAGLMLFSLLIMLTNPIFMHHYVAVGIFLFLAARGQSQRDESSPSS